MVVLDTSCNPIHNGTIRKRSVQNMPNLSICIITKNECDNLKICLDRIKDLGCEIVVVDTGSTDDSRKVASAITPCVYEFAWCDDFSAARNYAVQKAGNDWILFLDSDEFVDMFDMPKLLEQMQTMPASIGHIHIKSLYESDGQMMSSTEPIARLFSRSLYHFEGRIHEQIVPLDTSTEPDYFDAPIYVTHVGYQGNDAYRAEKADRNLKLLLRELEAQPDDPYTLYQIGNSYFYSKQYAQAIPYFERAMELPLDTKLSYVHSIINLYGYCLINTKRFADALMLEAVYDDFKGDADYLFVLGLIYMNNAQFSKAVESFLAATQIPSCVVDGVNSYSAFYNVGVILECLGDTKNALVYYEKAGNYTPALAGIERCKQV